MLDDQRHEHVPKAMLKALKKAYYDEDIHKSWSWGDTMAGADGPTSHGWADLGGMPWLAPMGLLHMVGRRAKRRLRDLT